MSSLEIFEFRMLSLKTFKLGMLSFQTFEFQIVMTSDMSFPMSLLQIIFSLTVFGFTGLPSNHDIFVFVFVFVFWLLVIAWNSKFICTRFLHKKNREGHEN